MSIEAMAWALSAPLGGNQKVVLLGLANHARPDFREARPAIATLATYAHCDPRTVQRHLRKLEEDGWVRAVGVHEADGRADRRITIYELRPAWQNVTPQASGVTATAERGDSAVASGVTVLSPKPSIEPSLEQSEQQSVSERAREWPGVPDEMRSDAVRLLGAKHKVAGRIVTEEEMSVAVSALAEFNRQADSDFGVGANLRSVVMRIRERPSWDVAKHVRLVQSAWRLRWWERNGNRKRPTPAVVWGGAFENVVQDAAEEAAGRLQPPVDNDLSTKTWPDGRRWDQLTRREQDNARDAAMMGIRPWEAPQEEPAAVPAQTNGHREVITGEIWAREL